jgi:TPR repeat protein
MINQLLLVITIWILVVTTAHSEIYIRDYYYTASEADSKISSRTNALDQVKLLLLQEVGIHIHQELKITKDGSGNTYATEDVEAVTAGLTKVEIIEENWNGDTYYLKAEIDVDTEQVLIALEEFKNNKSETNQQSLELIKNTQRQLEEARRELEKTKLELKNATSAIQKEKAQKEYSQKVTKLSSGEMLNRMWANYLQKKYIDAVYWAKKAAEQGNIDGQFNLGRMYEKGLGVKQDYTEAVNWYRKAADQGDVDGQFILGALYEQGLGVKQDYTEAVNWYRKAADQGDVYGQVMLGGIYDHGLGVKQDYTEAVNWYRKAADQGNIDGQFNLGRMYEQGLGVKRSDGKARQWFTKACKGGLKQACDKI